MLYVVHSKLIEEQRFYSFVPFVIVISQGPGGEV